MDYISSTKLGQETNHNKKTIDKIAKILNINPLYKTTQTFYTKEQSNQIINFINDNSPLEVYFNKMEIINSFGNDIKTLTAFKNIVSWDRSRILKCMEYLNIKPITNKGQTNYYSNDDFVKFSSFINDKFVKLNELKNYYTKSQICKNLKLNYEKFETLCKKFNICPIFDWEFGKDSKLYSDESFNFLFNLIEENKKQSEIKYTITELSEIFQKTDSCIAKVIEKLNISYFESINREYLIDDKSFLILQDYFSKTEISGSSYFEKEVYEFIKSIYFNNIIENDRKIISPKELDIYIPNKNVAIECNGLYWHDENHINKNFHLMKTKMCNEKNINLIHVFEDDWLYKKEIVKSMIASRLGIYQQKIFARKCKCQILDYKLYKELLQKFFDKNHLQGFAKCDVFVGLFYNDELVQCVGFNEKGWHDGNVELTRMVTKMNTQVVGGFSKLMVFVKKVYGFTRITSYVYRAWFNGKGYLASGFEIIKENPPSYSYVLNGKRIHKSYFRKNKLKKMYECGELKYFDENKSEHEIMLQNNIYRIYDCGTIKVIYEN